MAPRCDDHVDVVDDDDDDDPRVSGHVHDHGAYCGDVDEYDSSLNDDRSKRMISSDWIT